MAEFTHSRSLGKHQNSISRQLHELGVQFSQEDLAPHLTLSRMRKSHFVPDADYLNWAKEWLGQLQQANAHTHCYAEPAFSQALSHKWLQACWTARKKMGWTVGKIFLSATLNKHMLSTIPKLVFPTKYL